MKSEGFLTVGFSHNISQSMSLIHIFKTLIEVVESIWTYSGHIEMQTTQKLGVREHALDVSV